MTELWCLHIEGPDDVMAAPSKEEADSVAEASNRYFTEHFADSGLRAKVVPWPHSARSHAEDLVWWVTLQDIQEAAAHIASRIG